MPPKYVGELDEAALSDPNNTHARVLSLVGNDKRVLEIGCAVGYMTSPLVMKHHCDVVAIEIDPEAAAMAAVKADGARILTGDIEQPQGVFEALGSDPFHVILLADVLEHVKEPEVLLERIRALLRPKGSLIISIPNVAHWTVRANLLRGNFNYADKGIMDSGHLRFFTRKSILQLLHKAGYVIERLECTYIFPLHNRHPLGRYFAKRSMPTLFMEFFGYQFVVEAKAK